MRYDARRLLFPAAGAKCGGPFEVKGVTMPELMNFGDALAKLKSGTRVARLGWNGILIGWNGIWIAYQKAYPSGIPINANTAEATGTPQGTVCKFLPYIMMKTADGSFVPWVASQTDVLAEDWVTVP
jgi:hypothetical protein